MLSDPISRRTVLKGLAAAGAVVSLPAVIASCGSSDASTAPSAARPSARTPVPSAAAGSLTLGSSYSNKATDAKAMKAVAESFTTATGIAVSIDTVDHDTFVDGISPYLQGTPDDVFTWVAGYRMRFFADQGLAVDISDLWAKVASDFSDPIRAASTGNDGRQYLVPFTLYPWVVIYRKSLFAEKAYTVPATWGEFTRLAKRMQADGLTPLAFGDKDGWPALGVFDILDLRVNGYQYHLDLLRGVQRWTDPKTAAVFEAWKDLLPFVGDLKIALGRSWQDTVDLVLADEAGMCFLGTTACAQATEQEDRDDLDVFPFPTLGTDFDDELGIDAPIDGFMMATRSPTLAADEDAALAFLEHVGSGPAQVMFLDAAPNSVAAATDADQSGYSALQAKSAAIIADSRAIAGFFERDTDPAFAAKMQTFLRDWLTDPRQDLGAFLKTVQAFWDSLGIS